MTTISLSKKTREKIKKHLCIFYLISKNPIFMEYLRRKIRIYEQSPLSRRYLNLRRYCNIVFTFYMPFLRNFIYKPYIDINKFSKMKLSTSKDIILNEIHIQSISCSPYFHDKIVLSVGLRLHNSYRDIKFSLNFVNKRLYVRTNVVDGSEIFDDDVVNDIFNMIFLSIGI